MTGSDFASPTISDLQDETRFGEALAALVQAGLQQRGRLRLRLQGASMWPTIPAGSLVEVERLGPEEIRPGDVVVWQQGNQLVAHRVVRVRGTGPTARLLTKGDNNASPDGELAAVDVLGRLVAVLKVNGSRRSSSHALRRFEAGFWLARWRTRSALSFTARVLPAGVSGYLVSLRDRLGQLLSRGYEGLWLRY